MTRLKRREKKYLGSLVALFEHEEKQLRKYRVVAKVLTILGSALFGMALIPVMQAD